MSDPTSLSSKQVGQRNPDDVVPQRACSKCGLPCNVEVCAACASGKNPAIQVLLELEYLLEKRLFTEASPIRRKLRQAIELSSAVETLDKPVGAQRFWSHDAKGVMCVRAEDYEALRLRFVKACARISALEKSPEEPKEPLDPTPEMIMQGVWAWQRGERFNTAEDVRAIYITMRRMEGRSAKETKRERLRDSDAAFNLGVLPTEQPEKASELPTQRVVNAAGTAAYDIPQYIEVNEDGSPLNGDG